MPSRPPSNYTSLSPIADDNVAFTTQDKKKTKTHEWQFKILDVCYDWLAPAQVLQHKYLNKTVAVTVTMRYFKQNSIDFCSVNVSNPCLHMPMSVDYIYGMLLSFYVN